MVCHFKFFKGCILQILIDAFLNALFQILFQIIELNYRSRECYF